jgi:shikimate kinase
MRRPGRIVLIGFMASGKSMVGRLLAARLGYQFADTDALVVEREGTSIARIFAEKGEPAFRKAESAVLKELVARERIVVATGGGAPAQSGNAWFFKAVAEGAAGATSAPGAAENAGPADVAVFYLRVSLETARERTHGDRGRPLLSRGEAEVKRLYQGRLPLYESLGAAIETDNRSPESIAAEINRILDSPMHRRSPAGNA